LWSLKSPGDQTKGAVKQGSRKYDDLLASYDQVVAFLGGFFFKKKKIQVISLGDMAEYRLGRYQEKHCS
jgi:hypothetical protein